MVGSRWNHISEFYGIDNALKIIPANEVAACNLPFRLDTYLSCQHNCSYCYARYNLYSHGKWNPLGPKPINSEDFEKKLISANKDRKRKSKVSQLLEKKFPLRIGTNTDCFQPIERDKKVTKRVLEILDDWEYPYIINTKSDLAAKQPYLKLISDSSGGAIVQYTIISIDENLVSKLEPNAPTVKKRLKSIRRFSDQGVHVQVRVSPIIPNLTSPSNDFEALAEKVRDMGAKDLIVEFLRYTSSVEESASSIKDWVAEATNGSVDLDKIYQEWGVETKPKPKPDRDGYIRVPMKEKFKYYSKYKEIARGLGINLYVCSEEYPEINNCVNCCGVSEPQITENFRGFKLHNEAASNTIACFMRERGEVGFKDIKKNFFCVDWDIYQKKWEKMDQYLVNAKKKITPKETRYVYEDKFRT